MFNPVSVLDGKSVAGEVTVADAGLRGMITLRGDLNNKKLRSVCAAIAGVAVPDSGQIQMNGDNGIAWMSPDELLLLVPHDAVPDALAKIEKALAGVHHLAVNVSDARAMITMTGPFVREVIAKLAPVDLHPDSFTPGTIRRSRLGQVAAAFWLQDETTCYVICFRSVADYAFNLLATSAQAGPVDHFA